MQIIKKLFCSHFSVNKGLIQHVVQSCYNYNITFRKLEIHTVKMRPISACYTSGSGARHFLGIGRCTTTSNCEFAKQQKNLFHKITLSPPPNKTPSCQQNVAYKCASLPALNSYVLNETLSYIVWLIVSYSNIIKLIKNLIISYVR